MLISITLPNYNHGVYLQERLRSILAQLPEDGEIVFYDDASTDNSLAIAEEAAAQDKRLRIIRNEKNVGAITALNRAVEAARGEYFCPAAADDVYLPNFIERSLQALLDHPQCSFCCSDNGVLDNEKVVQYNRTLLGVEETRAVSPRELARAVRYDRFSVAGTSIMMRRKTVLYYGGYSKNVGPASDWFVNHIVPLVEGLVYIPEVLSLWRKGNYNYSNAGYEREGKRAMLFGMLEILLDNRPLRTRFCRSMVLHNWIDQFFWEILFKHPKHYDFLFYSLVKYNIDRWRRHYRSIKKLPKKLGKHSPKSQ